MCVGVGGGGVGGGGRQLNALQDLCVTSIKKNYNTNRHTVLANEVIIKYCSDISILLSHPDKRQDNLLKTKA